MRSGVREIFTVVDLGSVRCFNSDHAADEQTDGDSERSADKPGDEKGMVDHVFADPRGAGAVEVNRGDNCAVVRDKEVAVHSREHSYEQQWPDAQRKS